MPDIARRRARARVSCAHAYANPAELSKERDDGMQRAYRPSTRLAIVALVPIVCSCARASA